MSRARRISTFSERDRVRLRALGDGAEFVWRGARWIKRVFGHDQQYGVVGPTEVSMGFRISMRVSGDAKAGPSAVPQGHTRVVVSRTSGEALRARELSRTREGDR